MQKLNCDPDPLEGMFSPENNYQPYTHKESIEHAGLLCSLKNNKCNRCVGFGGDDPHVGYCVGKDNPDFEPDKPPVRAAWFGICDNKQNFASCPECINPMLGPPDCEHCSNSKMVAPGCGDNTCVNMEAEGCNATETTGKFAADGVSAGMDGGQQTATSWQESLNYFKPEGGYQGCRTAYDDGINGDCKGDFVYCTAFNGTRAAPEQAVYDSAKQTERCKKQQCDGFCEPRGWGPQEATVNGEEALAGKCGK